MYLDFASKEVILSAGALDTPRILMHSGLGPAKQLEEYKIPVVKDIPAVGQGLRDHMFVPLVHTRTKESTDRASFYGDDKVMEDALQQWKTDGTGPWSTFACETGIGFFKLENIALSKEFQDLPQREREYLQLETIPHTEIFTHFPIHWFIADFPKENLNYSCFLVFLYNAQSRGETTLQSSDPDVPLRFNPKFLEHPFDRRLCIESLRDALRLVKSEAYSRDSLAQIAGPKSDSDEDLLAHWTETIGTSWHMTGTVKMGRPGESDAAVDNDFRLMGIEGLRVADMSVLPILPNCHTQAVAYVTGITCAEKLVSEYNLT
jgi:choline dehydrogenase-like flavoprotein